MSEALRDILLIVGIYIILFINWPFIIRLALNVALLHFIFQLMYIWKVDWDALNKLMHMGKYEYWGMVIGVVILLRLVRGIFLKTFNLERS